VQIHIDQHTPQRKGECVTSEGEIVDLIETIFTIPANLGRVGRAKVCEFKTKRHGKNYEHKKIIFTPSDNIYQVQNFPTLFCDRHSRVRISR
jgi:hypothetical protein